MSADGNQFTFHTAEQAFGALEQAGVQIAAFKKAMAPILDQLGLCAYGKANGNWDAESVAQIIEEHLRENYPDCFKAVEERWEDSPLASKTQQKDAA